jgi:hypothetical protein
LGGEIELEEGLPDPWVHYPEKGQYIFAFSKNINGDLNLCSCISNGINFLAKTNEMEPLDYISKNRKLLPKSIQEKVTKLKRIDDLFEDKLCHACNQTLPNLASSNYSYASFVFAKLRWYKQQELLSLEIEPGYHWASIKRTPDEYTEYLNIVNVYFKDHIGKLKSIKDARRKINSMVENRVKERFNLSDQGGSSQAEFLLFQIVREMVKPAEVVRHFRPKYLEGLEIDIWIPEYSLGLEYQGEQHFKVVEFWGGMEGLKDLQIRDQKKRSLCEKNGVNLVEINFFDPITSDFVPSKIGKYLDNE